MRTFYNDHEVRFIELASGDVNIQVANPRTGIWYDAAIVNVNVAPYEGFASAMQQLADNMLHYYECADAANKRGRKSLRDAHLEKAQRNYKAMTVIHEAFIQDLIARDIALDKEMAMRTLATTNALWQLGYGC